MGIIFGTHDLPQRSEKYEIIKHDVVENVDVCIIGSGAAGAVLAKEFVEKGKTVVLLEKGGYYEEKDMNQRDIDMMPLLWKNSGFNFDDKMRIAIAQGSCLGGSTIINDAVCFDTPTKVRDEWKKLGVNFSNQEWSDNFQRVNSFLHVTPVSDPELNRNNQMLMRGAQLLGLTEGKKNHRNCVDCMQCGFCHLGCHYGTKQNVLVTYIHEAMKQPDSSIRIYCNCNVTRIIHNQSIAVGVEGTFYNSAGENTFRIRVNSKIVIISAGTIASSKLLLKNGMAQKTAGRGICLHPAPFVLGDYDYEIKGNQGIPMAFTVHDFGVTRTSDKARIANNFSDGEFLIESIFLPLLQFSMALPTNLIQHEELLHRFNNYSMAGILVRDGNNGRFALTPTGGDSLTYSLGQKELGIIAKGVEILTKMWFKLGAKRVINSHRDKMILEDESELEQLKEKILHNPENLLLGSAHPQSGNKIGTDSENSAVDSDCKVHGFKNLFVCDASVFPTAVGVNPQITVMTIASIVAQRIANKWKHYSSIPLSKSLGNTCDITQPMHCLRNNLSDMFDSTSTQYGADELINSNTDKLDNTNWSFDPAMLMISNDLYWKGLYPRDSDVQNEMTMYFGGFYKKFTKTGITVSGITHPFEAPVFAKNEATDTVLPDFGKVVMLKYTEPGYDQFYDVLKIADKNTILGKAFFGTPKKGQEMLTFSMSRKYPFEFMTELDHEMLYSKMKKPPMNSMVGIWEGYLVSDSAWSPPVFRFRYYYDNKVLKNDYIFGNILSGTAVVHDKGDHLEMQDITGIFHDEIRLVNENILIGKYYSVSNELLQLIPVGISFLHADPDRSSTYLPYILKKVGEESAYTGYTVDTGKSRKTESSTKHKISHVSKRRVNRSAKGIK